MEEYLFSEWEHDENIVDDIFGGVDMDESYFSFDSVSNFHSVDYAVPSYSLVESVSFGGRISDLYDENMNTHLDNAGRHISEAFFTQDANVEKYHWQKAENELETIKFWQNCEKDALIDSQRDWLFADTNVELWDKMNKWQQDYEDICFNRK